MTGRARMFGVGDALAEGEEGVWGGSRSETSASRCDVSGWHTSNRFRACAVSRFSQHGVNLGVSQRRRSVTGQCLQISVSSDMYCTLYMYKYM